MVSIWIIIAPLYTAHEITVQGSIIVNVIVVVILETMKSLKKGTETVGFSWLLI